MSTLPDAYFCRSMSGARIPHNVNPGPQLTCPGCSLLRSGADFVPAADRIVCRYCVALSHAITQADAAKDPHTMSNFSHAAIPAADLTTALANAALDPDGQVYPWLPAYPLIGATVVAEGQLWTVAHRERGPGRDNPVKLVKLVGQGHDGILVATRDELRPVTWTNADESWKGRE